MTAEGLAIVFSPNLLRAPQDDFAMILANMGHTHKLVKALITHVSIRLRVSDILDSLTFFRQFHVIFDDADPEAEVDIEDEELDSPILLEDVVEDEEDELQPTLTEEPQQQTPP